MVKSIWGTAWALPHPSVMTWVLPLPAGGGSSPGPASHLRAGRATHTSRRPPAGTVLLGDTRVPSTDGKPGCAGCESKGCQLGPQLFWGASRRRLRLGRPVRAREGTFLSTARCSWCSSPSLALTPLLLLPLLLLAASIPGISGAFLNHPADCFWSGWFLPLLWCSGGGSSRVLLTCPRWLIV